MELKEKLNEALAETRLVQTDEWYVKLTKQDIETLLDAISTAEIFTKIDLEDKQPDLPAPNTVMWWLCRIADPEIRRKAVGNCFKYHITIFSQVFDINVAVQCGFGWINTKEGNGYWYDLSKSEIPLLPEPDFTEYNELRK